MEEQPNRYSPAHDPLHASCPRWWRELGDQIREASRCIVASSESMVPSWPSMALTAE